LPVVTLTFLYVIGIKSALKALCVLFSQYSGEFCGTAWCVFQSPVVWCWSKCTVLLWKFRGVHAGLVRSTVKTEIGS